MLLLLPASQQQQEIFSLSEFWRVRPLSSSTQACQLPTSNHSSTQSGAILTYRKHNTNWSEIYIPAKYELMAVCFLQSKYY